MCFSKIICLSNSLLLIPVKIYVPVIDLLWIRELKYGWWVSLLMKLLKWTVISEELSVCLWGILSGGCWTQCNTGDNWVHLADVLPPCAQLKSLPLLLGLKVGFATTKLYFQKVVLAKFFYFTYMVNKGQEHYLEDYHSNCPYRLTKLRCLQYGFEVKFFCFVSETAGIKANKDCFV